MTQKYDPKSIEAKWQKYWEDKELFKTPEDATLDNKYYILPQLPYPSGSGLHVGHAEVYSACDIFARYQRMQGKKVLQVIGWDSFGLPAENYAIKTNVHPRVSTDSAVENFRKQIKALGISVDWDREVGAHNPDYYKWTQWFFLLFYKRGLAYRKKQAVNWCDSCKTVLANDQVKEGQCERCDTVIVQKDMEQWYIKITDYAERLLNDIDKLDWPEETKKRQKDWIGKSEGATVKFQISNFKFQIEVFTTRPDTLFGATYMVLAPEGEIIQNLKLQIQNWDEVDAYIQETSKKTELDRQVQKEKTGVELKGIKAINPVNGEEIPIFVADYVLASYGTGAIMAVPAHDERDFEFAVSRNEGRVMSDEEFIKILCVIEPMYLEGPNPPEELWEEKISILEGKEVYTGDGKLINSDFLDGLTVEKAKEKMIEWLEKNGVGQRKVQYKLRDWSVSRQRFWGAPIPMLTNEECKMQNAELNETPDFVLNLHAWGSNPKDHFHSWIDKNLHEQGITSVTPELPNANNPILSEWLSASEAVLPANTKNLVITGRSLSCWAALKLAETTPVRKLVLCAPTLPTDTWFTTIKQFCESDEQYELLKNFVSNGLDVKKVTQNVGELVVMLSTTDPYIDMHDAEQWFATHFPQARVMRIRDAGHFDADHGYTTFDALVEEILRPVYSHLKPIFESDLPVILPDDVDFKPTGESPLNYSQTFNEGVEEKYGKGWHREPDTLDTFMCSSWYYYRYLDPKNDGAFASPEALKKWMPVDFYLGGPEHVNGHLLYSRFFTKVLFDAGYIDFDEPFKVHRHQGLILGPDGRKMSKRWGNVINPTDVVETYGADTMRMYEMFMGPLEDDKPWDENGVKGVRRFLEKVWKLQEKVAREVSDEGSPVEKLTHKTLKKVGDDLASLGFNTAIAKMMELVNEMSKAEKLSITNYQFLIAMISPFAPHMADELWELLGNEGSVSTQAWPTYDESKLVEDTVTLAVQVNGKVRAEITVATDDSEEEVKKLALEQENVVKWLEGNEPKKVIYVKGRLVSVVV